MVILFMEQALTLTEEDMELGTMEIHMETEMDMQQDIIMPEIILVDTELELVMEMDTLQVIEVIMMDILLLVTTIIIIILELEVVDMSIHQLDTEVMMITNLSK